MGIGKWKIRKTKRKKQNKKYLDSEVTRKIARIGRLFGTQSSTRKKQGKDEKNKQGRRRRNLLHVFIRLFDKVKKIRIEKYVRPAKNK